MNHTEADRIKWGEDDVRDAVAEFDPGYLYTANDDFWFIKAESRGVKLFVYCRGSHGVHFGGRHRSFFDQIEAVAFAKHVAGGGEA